MNKTEIFEIENHEKSKLKLKLKLPYKSNLLDEIELLELAKNDVQYRRTSQFIRQIRHNHWIEI